MNPDDEEYKKKLFKVRKENWEDLWHLPWFVKDVS